MAIVATSAWAYDFSAVAPSGQTLYYNIVSGHAELTYPGSYYYSPYNGYTAPSGNLVIPASVTYSGTTYSVTSIGQSAFYYCGNLTSVIIPDGVTSIGNSAFYGCSGLTSVTIPDGVTSIGEYAFCNCSGLTSVTIPDSVTSIGSFAFENCSGLTSATIPDGVTSIGSSAFNNCSGLTSVTIGSGVTSIGESAFYGCSNLTSVVIPDGVTSIGFWAFYEVRHIEYHGGATGSPWGAISMNGVTDGDFVFSDSTKHYLLAYSGAGGDITIPSMVDTIGSKAFYNCSGLTSVTIPDGVTSIGNSAFEGCNSLTSVTIPDGVTSIGSYAFYGCSSLDTVYMKPSTPPTLGNNAIAGNASNRVFVLFGCVYDDYYNASSWTSYRSALREPIIDNDINLAANDDLRGYAVIIPASDNRDIACDSTAVIHATANYGYHFTQWSDGVTDNPRTLTLTQDTAFTAMFESNQYAVTGVPSDTVYGMVSGSDTVDYLDSVTLTAVANYGYHFTQWNDNSVENPRKVAATDNISMTAYFYYNQYTITLTPDTTIHGTVSGAGSFNYLSERTISATANYGYHFAQWSDGVTDNPRTLTLTWDTTLTVMFEPNQYAITGVPSNPVYGMVSGSDTVDYLDSVTLTAVANYGYHFTRWNDNSVENPRKVAATANVSMTAYFGYNQYTITLAPDTTIHGTVSGAGTYNYLSERTISATANYGYHFTQWSDGVTDNPRTITLTQDTTLTAIFEPNQYAVTGVPSFDVYGMVSGSDTVDYLDTVTLTATPNYGYQFQYWYRDGYYGSVQTNPMQVVASGNIYYTAYFTPMVYTVGTQAEHGSIYISGSRQYQTQVSLTVTANYGYRFTQWSDGVTDNPRTFTITQDTSFTALFEHNEYTLAFQSADTTKGVVTVASVPGLYLDTTPYVTAAALPHYHFTQWNDGSTENPRRFVFDGDHTYTASFAIDVHTVGVQVDHLAHGTVSGAGSREYGQPITVSATAYSGYQFTHWSDGSTYNPYTFAVLEDKDLTAIFVADGEPWQDTVVLYDTAYVLLHDTTYLNVMVHDTTVVRDTTYIDVPYAVHDTTYITLTDTVTNTVYDTVTNTVYDTVDNYIYDTVTVTDTLWLTRTDTLWLHDTVTVHDTVYVTGEGIDGAEALNAKVYSSHGQVVVEGADGHAVALYDVNGRLLARKEESGERSVFDVTASGTYMIKIGHYPARKVVVVR